MIWPDPPRPPPALVRQSQLLPRNEGHPRCSSVQSTQASCQSALSRIAAAGDALERTSVDHACLASSRSSWSLLSWRGISRNASDQVSMLAAGQAPISSLGALAPHGHVCMSGLSGTTFCHALTLQGPHGKSHAATAMPMRPSPCHAMPPASLKAYRFLARARLL